MLSRNKRSQMQRSWVCYRMLTRSIGIIMPIWGGATSKALSIDAYDYTLDRVPQRSSEQRAALSAWDLMCLEWTFTGRIVTDFDLMRPRSWWNLGHCGQLLPSIDIWFPRSRLVYQQMACHEQVRKRCQHVDLMGFPRFHWRNSRID